MRRLKVLAWILFLMPGGCSRCGGPPPPRPPAPGQERPVHVVMVGDTLLADASQPLLNRHGYDHPFVHLKDLVSDHDLLVVNLEGPITEHPTRHAPSKSYSYKASPSSARALANLGVDLACLANNHAFDYGLQGMRDTMRHLKDVGIGSFGAGEDEARAVEGVVLEIAGARIGFVGFMEPHGDYEGSYRYFATGDRPGVARMDAGSVRRSIQAMRPGVDTLIASFHWGRNYERPTATQREMGRLAAEAGADVVVGHHPHVAQGIELHRGVPILYSLGNFAFGTPGRFRKVDPRMAYGWVADIAIEGGRVARLALTPIEVDNQKVHFQPRRAAEGRLAEWLGFVNEPFGTRMEIVAGKAVLDLASPAPAAARRR